jgi:hypothetical protein
MLPIRPSVNRLSPSSCCATSIVRVNHTTPSKSGNPLRLPVAWDLHVLPVRRERGLRVRPPPVGPWSRRSAGRRAARSGATAFRSRRYSVRNASPMGGGDVEGTAQPAIRSSWWRRGSLVENGAPARETRGMSASADGRQAGVQVGILQQPGVEDGRPPGAWRQHHGRGLPHAGRRMAERGDGRAPGLAVVSRARRGRAASTARAAPRRSVPIESTACSARARRAAARRRSLPRSTSSAARAAATACCRRRARAAAGRASPFDSDTRGGGGASLVHDPIDAPALAVAHRGLVRVARTVAESRRRRIVLRDEVVPVGHPHRAVRADLRVDRRHPLLGAGQQVPAVARDERRAVCFSMMPCPTTCAVGSVMNAMRFQ